MLLKGQTTTWYVNDNSTENDIYCTAISQAGNVGTPESPFASIAAAINASSAGDVIYVDAGTYTENITVNKSLDIRGANYNISPNTGVRVAESVIIPASSDPVNGNVVTITSSGVKFRGFTVDGDNTFLADAGGSDPAFPLVTIDALRGIFASLNGLSKTLIENNIVRNVAAGAIRFQQATNQFPTNSIASGTFANDNLANDNLCQNCNIGIDVRWSGFAGVTNNVVTNARYGIFFGDCRIENRSAPQYKVISGNTLAVRQWGMWFNLYRTTPYTVSNNTITAVAQSSRAEWFGVMMANVSTLQNHVNQNLLPLVNTPEYFSFENNNVNGVNLDPATKGYGYWLWAVDNGRTPGGIDNFTQITGGSVINVTTGIEMRNVATVATGTSLDAAFGTANVGAHVNISGVSISVNNGGAGINILDEASWTSSNPAPLINKRDVKLGIGSGVTISGGTRGIDISHPASGTANYTAYNSVTSGALNDISISGQSGDYISLTNHANGLDGTLASFDGNTGGAATLVQNYTIEDKITHKMDNSTKGLVRVKANNIFVTSSSGSVQRGIDAATTGNVVNVAAGTYTENITVDKQIHIIGAVNGNNATRLTVINSALSSIPVLTISSGGMSSNNRLIVKDLSITGATGTDNSGSGVLIASSSEIGFITLENIASISNAGHGIAFNSTASIQDVKILSSNISTNSGIGIRIASAVPSITDLEIDGCLVAGNGGSGFSFNPSGTITNIGTGFIIKNTTISNNGISGTPNTHDISFFGFTGSAMLENVMVISGNGTTQNSNSYGIVFDRGVAGGALGSVLLSNVSVTGYVGKGALIFQRYNDVSLASLSGVSLNSCVAPWGSLILNHTGSSAFNVGNTSLRTIGIWSTGGADATNANFYHATTNVALDRDILADAYQIEDQVIHKIDSATIGFVKVKDKNIYITPLSFAPMGTFYPSIQRGIDAATAGDVVNVAAGTYTDQSITVNKRLDIRGAGENTIVQYAGGNVLTYTALGSGLTTLDRAYLRDMKISGSSKGLYASELVNYLTLDGVTFDGNSSYAIHLNNVSDVMNDWVIKNCLFNANSDGFRMGMAANIDGLSITGTTFSNQINSAIYIPQQSSSPGGCSDVIISGNTFTNNANASSNNAAMYIEKLSSASISNNTITNNGPTTNPRGILLNLKYGDYSNVTISGNTLNESRVCSGTTGMGILAAGLNTGSYATNPASLSNVLIVGNGIKGAYYDGLVIAGNVQWSSTTISNNELSNARRFLILLYGSTSASAMTGLSNNSFSGGVASIVNADAASTVSATCNYYGTNDPSGVASLISGSVTYIPWLVDGTDDEAEVKGFQPKDNTCLGGIPVTLTVEAPATAACGDEITIYIKAKDFTSYVAALQFSVNWDATELEYVSSTFAPEIYEDGGDEPIVTYLDEDNAVTYLWSDGFPTYGVAIPDHSILMSLVLRVKRLGEHSISITSIPTDVLAAGGEDFDDIAVLVNNATIEITDGIDPNITASEDVIESTDIDKCTASVTIEDAIFSDNCDGSILSWEMIGATEDEGDGQVGTYTFNKGVTTIIYTVTDPAGNVKTDETEVTIEDNQKPKVICDDPITVNTDEDACMYASSQLAPPTVDDNCTVMSIIASPAVLALGVNTVVWTVSDGSGNTETCEQEVTVNDEEDPVILGTPTSFTAMRTCAGPVSWTPPMADDNCLVTSFTSNFAPGDVFPIGVTEVTYTAVDVSGNFSISSFNVTIVEFTISVSSTNITCNGTRDGTASVSVENTQGTVTYLWSNGRTTETITGLAKGTYSVTVTNGSCSKTASVTITEPARLSATYSSSNVTCFGLSNGIILFQNPVGGYGTYEFSINNGSAWQSSALFSGLPAATYTLVIRDAANIECHRILGTLTITQPKQLQVTISASPGTNICQGTTTKLTAVVTGITTGLTYQWSNGATTSTVNINTLGTYNFTVTVTNITGCTAISSPVTVTVSPTVFASLSIISNVSGPVSPGTSITYTAAPINGGDNPIYSWRRNGVVVSGETGPVYTGTGWSNGESVQCVMTSNAPCVTGSPASSNMLFVSIEPSDLKYIVSDVTANRVYYYDENMLFVSSSPLSTNVLNGKTNVEDIWVTANNLYILDGSNKRIYRSNGPAAVSAVSKTLLSPTGRALNTLTGILIIDNHLLVLDKRAKIIYRYDLSSAFNGTGNYKALQQISLNSLNAAAEALSYDPVESLLYVLDNGTTKAFYKYQVNFTGSNITLGPSMRSRPLRTNTGLALNTPTGAVFDDLQIRVTDRGVDRSFNYDIEDLFTMPNTTNQNAISSALLNAGNLNSTGIGIVTSTNLAYPIVKDIPAILNDEIISDDIIVSIHNNPTFDWFKLVVSQLSDLESSNVKIYSNQGELIHHEEIPAGNNAFEKQYNVTDYRRGIYLVVVRQGSRHRILQLIVQ